MAARAPVFRPLIARLGPRAALFDFVAIVFLVAIVTVDLFTLILVITLRRRDWVSAAEENIPMARIEGFLKAFGVEDMRKNSVECDAEGKINTPSSDAQDGDDRRALP